MPVWTIAYMLLLLLMAAASTALKRRLGFPAWWLVLDTASMAVLLWLLVGYHRPEVIGAAGRSAAVLFVGVLVWLGISTHRELQVVERLPVLGEQSGAASQWVPLMGGVLLLAPALGFGAIAAYRSWQGGG